MKRRSQERLKHQGAKRGRTDGSDPASINSSLGSRPPTLSVSGEEKDPFLLWHQNKAMSQRLLEYKTESANLELHISRLKRKSASHDETLGFVHAELNKLENALRALVRSGDFPPRHHDGDGGGNDGNASLQVEGKNRSVLSLLLGEDAEDEDDDGPSSEAAELAASRRIEAGMKTRVDGIVEVAKGFFSLLSALKSENERLSAALSSSSPDDALAEANKRLREQVSRLETENDSLSSSSISLKAQCDTYAAGWLQSRARVAELEEELENTACSLTSARRSQKKLTDSLTEQTNKVSALMKSVEESTASPSSTSNVSSIGTSDSASGGGGGGGVGGSSSASGTTDQLREDLSEAKMLCEARLKKLEESRVQQERLANQLVRAHAALANPTLEMIRGAPDFKGLESRLHATTSELSRERERTEKAESSLKSATADRKRLLEKLKNSHDEKISRLEERVRSRDTQVARYRDERDKYKFELERLKLRLADEKTVSEYRNLLDTVNKTLEQTRLKLSKAQSAESSPDEAISDAKKRAERAELACAAAQKELAALKPAGAENAPSGADGGVSISHEEGARLRAAAARAEREAAELKGVVEGQRTEAEALIGEIAAIGEAFEEMQSQNARLLGQLQEKDEANTRLLSERIKMRQREQMLRGARDTLEAKAKTGESRCQALEDRIKASEALGAQLQTLVDELKAQSDGHEALARIAREEALANSDAAHAAHHKAEAAHRASQASLGAAEAHMARWKEEAARAQQLEEESSSLRRKVARLTASGAEPDDVVMAQLMEARRMLRCPVCNDNAKNVVLTRCFHTFCEPCIQTNLASRHRKCPSCGLPFGSGDVKTIFLGFEEDV